MLSEELLAHVRVVAMEHPTTITLLIKTLEEANTISYDETLKIKILNLISNKNCNRSRGNQCLKKQNSMVIR